MAPIGYFKILVAVDVLYHHITSDGVVHTDLYHRPITIEPIVISDSVTSQEVRVDRPPLNYHQKVVMITKFSVCILNFKPKRIFVN